MRVYAFTAEFCVCEGASLSARKRTTVNSSLELISPGSFF